MGLKSRGDLLARRPAPRFTALGHFSWWIRPQTEAAIGTQRMERKPQRGDILLRQHFRLRHMHLEVNSMPPEQGITGVDLDQRRRRTAMNWRKTLFQTNTQTSFCARVFSLDFICNPLIGGSCFVNRGGSNRGQRYHAASVCFWCTYFYTVVFISTVRQRVFFKSFDLMGFHILLIVQLDGRRHNWTRRDGNASLITAGLAGKIGGWKQAFKQKRDAVLKNKSRQTPPV